MVNELRAEFLRHILLPTPPIVPDTHLDVEDTAINKAKSLSSRSRKHINKKNTHVQ